MILKSSKFKYSKARDTILDAILSGNLAQDSILPSEQKLCALLGVSRITLRAALRDLEEMGIITKQHGSRSRVDRAALGKMRVPLRRIAWVDSSRIGHPNPIYFDIFRSLSEAAALRSVKIDYITLVIPDLADRFFERQNEYDGLVLGEFTSPYRHYLDRLTHPNCVSVDCACPGIAHCVKTDSYFGGRLAARALLDAGCTRPVCVRYAESAAPYPPYGERLRGFSDSLAEAGIELPPERIFEVKSADDEDNFPDFLRRRLPVLKKTDGVFAFCDKQAVDTLHALRKLGFDVPGQISVIGFDGLILSRFLSPPLTTIRQPVEEIGRKALEIVLNPAESSSYPPVIQIPPALQPGGTIPGKSEMKLRKKAL